MTDWWAEINNAPKDKPSQEKFAAMVLAQNDLYMVTSDTTQVMGDLEAALASSISASLPVRRRRAGEFIKKRQIFSAQRVR